MSDTWYLTSFCLSEQKLSKKLSFFHIPKSFWFRCQVTPLMLLLQNPSIRLLENPHWTCTILLNKNLSRAPTTKKHVWPLFIGHEFEIIYLVLAILWLWSKTDNVASLPVDFSLLCYFFMLYLENNNQRQFQALNPFCFHHIVLNTEQIQLVVSLSSCYSDVLHLWRQRCLLLCSSDNLEMWCWNFISIDGNMWGFCQVIPVFPGVPQNK